MHVFLHLISYGSGVKRTHDNDPPCMGRNISKLKMPKWIAQLFFELIDPSIVRHPPPHSEWSARLLGVEKINFVLHQHQSERSHYTVAVTPSVVYCDLFALVPPVKYLIFFFKCKDQHRWYSTRRCAYVKLRERVRLLAINVTAAYLHP